MPVWAIGLHHIARISFLDACPFPSAHSSQLNAFQITLSHSSLLRVKIQTT